MHKNSSPRKTHRDRTRATLACVVIMAFSTSLATPLGTAWGAAPGPKKRVLVVKVQRAADVPTIVATKVDGYVDTLIGMDSRIEVVAAADLAPPTAPEKPKGPAPKKGEASELSPLARAEAAAEQASKLAGRKRWAEAVKAWSKAIDLYAEAAAELEDHERFVAALAGRAYAYFASGYDDNGEEELAKVYATSPQFQLDAAAPESARAMAERVRARVTPAGVQLTVSANTLRATVFVDGKNRGYAPATIGDLARGDHLVRVVAEGFEPFGQRVTIADSGVEVQASLTAKAGTPQPAAVVPQAPAAAETGLESFAQSGDFGSAFQAAVKKVAQANRLDAVVMSYLVKDASDYALGMFVWEAGKQKLGAVEPTKVSGDLGGLQVAVLDLVEKASAMVDKMPPERVLVGRSPLYGGGEPAVAEVKPEPKPRPEPRSKPEPKPKPEPRSKPEPKPKPEPRTAAKEPVDEPLVVEPVGPGEPDDEPSDSILKKEEPLVLEPVEASVRHDDFEVRKKRDDGPEFYETWWFWTIVGGLAAGSAAAIVLTQDGGSDSPGGFSTTVTW